MYRIFYFIYNNKMLLTELAQFKNVCTLQKRQIVKSYKNVTVKDNEVK